MTAMRRTFSFASSVFGRVTVSTPFLKLRRPCRGRSPSQADASLEAVIAAPGIRAIRDRQFERPQLPGPGGRERFPLAVLIEDIWLIVLERAIASCATSGSTILSVTESDPFNLEKVGTCEAGAKFLLRFSQVQVEASALYNDFGDLQTSATKLANGLLIRICTNVGRTCTYSA
ncbi:hypothetical protein [Sphingobium sp. CFD-2]|uniref:hypothetical protein n=1 Tax=Sphingobium sp. CFD-2 TaxID=2878542 RepID=UPI00214C3C85|nr:hypothetical protein [Sphingobium sp. CFD-2]